MEELVKEESVRKGGLPHMCKVCHLCCRRARTAVFLGAWGLVVGTAAAQTDLSLSTIILHTPTPVPGEPIELDLVVYSTQACPDCAELQVGVWDDGADENLSCLDGRQVRVPMVTTAQSETVVPVVLSGYPRPGTYRAWFWVNCQQEIMEPDPSNNRGYLDILVYSPDAVPLPPPPDDPADPVEPPDPPDPTDPDPTDEPTDPVDPDNPVDPPPPAQQPVPSEPDPPDGQTPSDPQDQQDSHEEERAPALCGFVGPQSLIGVMIWLGTLALGLIGMKYRRRPLIRRTDPAPARAAEKTEPPM